MYDVRVRMMDDTGRLVGKMIDPLQFTVTMTESAQSTIDFSLTERAAGRLDTPFVVSVVASASGPHRSVRGGEFIVWEDDADDSDVTGTVRYSGIEFLPWLLSMNRVHWASTARNGTRTWRQGSQPGTVGYLISSLIAEGKARGWGTSLSIGFTASADSRGAAWTAAERQSEEWPLLTTVGDVLRQVTDNGLCDWYCEGTTLQLVRPGSGDVRSSIVLGGPQYVARPVKSSFKDVFTHLTVVPELARNWLYLTNTGATNRFGRLEASQTQSGVKDHSVATKNAQPLLTAGRATRRQFSFDWIPDAGGPIPFVDFSIGDTVWTQTRAGKRAQRVIGLQLTRTGQESVKVRAVTGDKLLGTAARAARKIGSVSVGGGVPGGTGSTVPVSPGRTFPLPAAPTAVRADANVSQWGADGSALTSVTIAWDQVSQAEDGSEVDVALYEISARREGTAEARAVLATTDALSWTATSWAVGVSRLVCVRAVAPNGDRSAWSTEILVTPASPARPLKVAGLQVARQSGSWRTDGTAQVDVSLEWDPVTLDTGGKMIPVSYEVASRSPERIDASPDTAAVTVSGWEPGTTRLVRVRAVSGGGKGEWSDELSVAVIVPSSIVPKAPSGLAVASNTAAFQTDGSALATVTITWTPVTQSIDNTSVQVREYEFRVGADTQRVTAASATFTVPTGRQSSVSVRALTTLNVWGDPATAIVVTGAAPAVAIPAPSAPVLTVGMGGVAYRWDGLTAAAAVMPAGFGRILVDSASSAAGPWATLGATLSAAGGGSVTGPVGTAIYLRFRSFDTLGRIGGTSLVRSATPAGVSIGELDPSVQTAISDAREIADGKNTIFPSVTEPVATAAGDLWWMLDDAGSSIVGVKMWNGTAWRPYLIVAEQIIATGSITGALVRANTLEVNHVSPTFGDDLNLSANESVTIIVGKQNEQADQLADVTESVGEAQSTADAATTAAGTAQATANGAASAAAGAATTAASVGQRLDRHQSYYRFGVDGLAIGDPNVPSELRLKPDRIEMTQNNIVVSYWEGGVFVADEARLDSAQIGNHLFTAYGAGRTVIRPL